MDEKTVFSFYNESVVCVQFIAESLVNLDKRNTNKEIVCIKNYQPFLYIFIYMYISFSFTNISKFLIEFKSLVEIISNYDIVIL